MNGHGHGAARRQALAALLVALATLSAPVLLGWSGVQAMAARWQAPEYSHGPAIPLLVLYLLALRARALAGCPAGGSRAGVLAFGLSLALVALGEFAAFPALSQYALVGAVIALAWAAGGPAGLRTCLPPLLLLVFMVPLPALVEDRVTASLQSVSAGVGVEIIRLAGYRAFRAGNVIDLGGYQLLVAEACSGLRYLFPLLGFSALCAVLFQGRWWQRAAILLAAVPVAVLMNSLRVGVTGVLVNRYGPGQAEGFLHYFEGWVIFMACVLVLFGGLSLLARVQRQDLSAVFALDVPARADVASLAARLRPNRPAVAAALLALAAAAASVVVAPPPERVPPRASLDALPRQFGGWQGRDLPPETGGAPASGASERLFASFTRPGEPAAVELRIDYCLSQRMAPCGRPPGQALASEAWSIGALGTRALTVPGTPAGSWTVNRVVLVRDDSRRLVYHWYAERGRWLGSALAREWYVLRDGLLRHRTDGASVRVTTPVVTSPGAGPASPAADLEAADRRLQSFVSALAPELGPHLPE